MVRDFGSAIEYESSETIFLAKNVKEIIETRFSFLDSSGQITQCSELFLGLSGDKGSSTTKLCVNFGNTINPNSPDNFTIIGMYKGDDNSENLRRNFTRVIEEVYAITTIKNLPVRWFLVGDLKFISAIIGHIGQAATYPCPFCEVTKEDLKAHKKGTPRTIGSINNLSSLRLTTSSSDPPTVLNRRFKGINHVPLINFSIEQIVPSPLHLLLGLTKIVVDRLENECEKMGTFRELSSALHELGAVRDPHTKNFTGNHVKKIISERGRNLIGECLRGEEELRDRLIELLGHLKIIQDAMKAAPLSPEKNSVSPSIFRRFCFVVFNNIL